MEVFGALYDVSMEVRDVLQLVHHVRHRNFGVGVPQRSAKVSAETLTPQKTSEKGDGIKSSGGRGRGPDEKSLNGFCMFTVGARSACAKVKNRGGKVVYHALST